MYRLYIRAIAAWLAPLTLAWVAYHVAGMASGGLGRRLAALVFSTPGFLAFVLPYCATRGGIAIWDHFGASRKAFRSVVVLGLSTSAAAVALGLAGGWIAHSLCAPMGTCAAAAATWGGPGLDIGHGLAAGLFALFGCLVAEMTGTTTPVAKRAAERWAAVLMFWYLHSFVTDLALIMGLDYGIPVASGALLPLVFITTVVVAVAWARHDRRTSHA